MGLLMRGQWTLKGWTLMQIADDEMEVDSEDEDDFEACQLLDEVVHVHVSTCIIMYTALVIICMVVHIY